MKPEDEITKEELERLKELRRGKPPTKALEQRKYFDPQNNTTFAGEQDMKRIERLFKKWKNS